MRLKKESKVEVCHREDRKRDNNSSQNFCLKKKKKKKKREDIESHKKHKMLRDLWVVMTVRKGEDLMNLMNY